MDGRNGAGSALIAINALSRRYGREAQLVTALDDITLDVREGEFVAVLGPSGCGKSTLMSILGLLESHDSGSYLLAGVDIARLSFDQRSMLRNRYIGFVFQAFNLIADLTVEENVGLPLRYSDVPRAQHGERVRSLLQRVGLTERARHFPHQLSGGQQQRVAIARAMVTGPALILADEPTGNLDSRHAAKVMDLLREFNREGATVIMVTHDEALARASSRRLRMLDGALVSED